MHSAATFATCIAVLQADAKNWCIFFVVNKYTDHLLQVKMHVNSCGLVSSAMCNRLQLSTVGVKVRCFEVKNAFCPKTPKIKLEKKKLYSKKQSTLYSDIFSCQQSTRIFLLKLIACNITLV
jgi:hypothetical protein